MWPGTLGWDVRHCWDGAERGDESVRDGLRVGHVHDDLVLYGAAGTKREIDTIIVSEPIEAEKSGARQATAGGGSKQSQLG